MSALLALSVGIVALVAGTALGWDSGLVDAVVAPPTLVRAGLVAGSVLLAVWLLLLATARIADLEPAEGEPGGPVAPGGAVAPGSRDLRGLLRAVRLVFLAIAAFAAAGGWILGSALPLIVALVIAGIDVVETSFLLLVVAPRREH